MSGIREGSYLTNKAHLSILLLMETVVTIDVEILNKAMKVADGQTQRQLVEDALLSGLIISTVLTPHIQMPFIVNYFIIILLKLPSNDIVIEEDEDA
jgi:hypothetical protein